MIRSLGSIVATMQASMTSLETQVGQISSAVNQMNAKNSTEFPSQVVPNPNVSAITTRSGKELEAIVKNPVKKC